MSFIGIESNVKICIDNIIKLNNLYLLLWLLFSLVEKWVGGKKQTPPPPQ